MVQSFKLLAQKKKKKEKKGGKRKKKTQGFGANAAGSVVGAVQDPHFSKARRCHPLQQGPPQVCIVPVHRVLPGGDPNRGSLGKTPQNRRIWGSGHCAALQWGRRPSRGRGGSWQSRMDGWTDRQRWPEPAKKISAGKGRWQGIEEAWGVVVGF